MGKDIQTREEWLVKAIQIFEKDLFKPHGFKIPKVKVSVGLPYGRGSKKAIGQHWHPNASDDKIGSIFISPTINDGIDVLGTLVHELVHAVVGNEAKHGAKFRKCAVAVGLTGKMTATEPDAILKQDIKTAIKTLGEYPHSKLNLGMRPVKKQTSRMIKMTCDGCGYIARSAITKIIEQGPVICPCNKKPMSVEMPEEDL